LSNVIDCDAIINLYDTSIIDSETISITGGGSTATVYIQDGLCTFDETQTGSILIATRGATLTTSFDTSVVGTVPTKTSDGVATWIANSPSYVAVTAVTTTPY